MPSISQLQKNIAENERKIKWYSSDIEGINKALPKLRQDRKDVETCRNYHKKTLEKKWFWKGPKYDNYSVYHYKVITLANSQLAAIDYAIYVSEDWKQDLEERIPELQAEINRWQYQIDHWDDD